MQFVVFWNIEWLKQRLSQKPLNGREIYIYCFCWLVLFSLSCFNSIPANEDTLSTIFCYLDRAIPLAGLFYAWLGNGGKNGRDFISRFISLGWVVTMRALVFFLPVFFILGFAPMEQSALLFETAETLTSLFIIWRISHHIVQLRQQLEPE